MKKLIFSLFLILTLLLPASLFARESIKCATTVATQETGILEYLLPLFTADSGIDVKVIAVDGDKALEMGKNGEVDCLITHNKEMELELVKEEFFLDRHDIMYDDFVILGPESDPADVKSSKSASEGFAKIRKKEALFISRGDNSDTNMLENRIWISTGRMPGLHNKWYRSLNQDMETTIRTASANQGYTLADRGTWLAMQHKQDLNLTILLEHDPVLYNQYGAMIVNQKNHPHVEYRLAMNLIIWLTSPDGQDAIGAYKNSSGDILFTPNAN